MDLEKLVNQNKDTTGWSMVSLILGLALPAEIQSLLVQAVVIILFPSVGWTFLYFVQREIKYRFPPKEPKTLPDKSKEVIQ